MVVIGPEGASWTANNAGDLKPGSFFNFTWAARTLRPPERRFDLCRYPSRSSAAQHYITRHLKLAFTRIPPRYVDGNLTRPSFKMGLKLSGVGRPWSALPYWNQRVQESLQLEKWLRGGAWWRCPIHRSKNVTSRPKVRRMNDIEARRVIMEPNLGSAESPCRLLFGR
jgi:hypothetical protein